MKNHADNKTKMETQRKGSKMMINRTVPIFLFFVSLLSFGLTFILLHSNAQSDQGLNEAFLKAVSAKDLSLMEKLLKEGADINATESEGKFTALTEAAADGDLEIVNYLLQKGAKPDGVQIFPNSPIYFAIFGDHITVVRRLLDQGIDPNYAWPNRNGGTLLIVAVQDNRLDIVKLLIQRGADVNFTGNGDHSPLFRSIIYDRFNVYKLLLSKGACLNKQDRKVLSEVEWENVKEDKKYIQLLKKHKKCK